MPKKTAKKIRKTAKKQKVASKKASPIFKKNRDYRAMFVAGVMFFLFAAMMDSVAFFVLGVAFAAIGIANKDKWSDESCRMDKKTALIAAVVAVVVAIVTVFIVRLF